MEEFLQGIDNPIIRMIIGGLATIALLIFIVGCVATIDIILHVINPEKYEQFASFKKR